MPLDGRRAAAARLARTAVHPRLFASPPVAGGDDGGVLAVGVQHSSCHPHQAAEVAYVSDGYARVHAADEADLAAVDVPDAGEIALVQQRQPDWPVRIAGQPRHGTIGVPVAAEEVRPEVADEVVFVSPRHD